ncbi:MAG: Lipopolysaccharide export system permease protein LptF, partial [uncultured Gemmatimonadaceae bacterium]
RAAREPRPRVLRRARRGGAAGRRHAPGPAARGPAANHLRRDVHRRARVGDRREPPRAHRRQPRHDERLRGRDPEEVRPRGRVHGVRAARRAHRAALPARRGGARDRRQPGRVRALLRGAHRRRGAREPRHPLAVLGDVGHRHPVHGGGPRAALAPRARHRARGRVRRVDRRARGARAPAAAGGGGRPGRPRAGARGGGLV